MAHLRCPSLSLGVHPKDGQDAGFTCGHTWSAPSYPPSPLPPQGGPPSPG